MAMDEQGFQDMDKEKQRKAAKEGEESSSTSFEKGSERARRAGKEGNQ